MVEFHNKKIRGIKNGKRFSEMKGKKLQLLMSVFILFTLLVRKGKLQHQPLILDQVPS